MFFVLTVSPARVPTRRFPAMEVIFSGSHGSEAGPMSSTFPQGNCCGVDASLSVNAEPDGARSEEWKNSQSTVVKSRYQPHAKVAVLNTAPSPMHNASHARGGTRKMPHAGRQDIQRSGILPADGWKKHRLALLAAVLPQQYSPSITPTPRLIGATTVREMRQPGNARVVGRDNVATPINSEK